MAVVKKKSLESATPAVTAMRSLQGPSKKSKLGEKVMAVEATDDEEVVGEENTMAKDPVHTALMDDLYNGNTAAPFTNSLSKTAKEACIIVDKIRRYELDTVWTNRPKKGNEREAAVLGVEEWDPTPVQSQHNTRFQNIKHREEQAQILRHQEEDDPASGHYLYPGMPIRSIPNGVIESTALWDIARMIPKGALLHAHLEAMFNVDWLVSQAMEKDNNFALIADQPLILPLEGIRITFKYIGPMAERRAYSLGSNIYTPSYIAGTPIPVWAAACMFPYGESTGTESFKTWLRTSIITRYPPDYYGDEHGIWSRFQQCCFPPTGSLLFHEDVLRRGLRERLFPGLVTDGVSHAEFRLVLAPPFYELGSNVASLTYNPMLAAIADELLFFQRTNPDFSLKLILCGRRWETPIQIERSLVDIVALKQAFPDLICGFDFVGHEAYGSLQELAPMLGKLQALLKDSGLVLPFVFHAGETMNPGSAAATNVVDALCLETRRVGHGISLLALGPAAIQKAVQDHVAVEVSPISNEVLGYCPISAHPAQGLLAHGVRVVLGSDDPGMMMPGDDETISLSKVFWAALHGWEGLGLAGLGSLAKESVRCSLKKDVDNDEWQRRVGGSYGLDEVAMEVWQKKWETFCSDIVQKYGDEWLSDNA